MLPSVARLQCWATSQDMVAYDPTGAREVPSHTLHRLSRLFLWMPLAGRCGKLGVHPGLCQVLALDTNVHQPTHIITIITTTTITRTTKYANHNQNNRVAIKKLIFAWAGHKSEPCGRRRGRKSQLSLLQFKHQDKDGRLRLYDIRSLSQADALTTSTTTSVCEQCFHL